jgi:hypothetical protein
MKERKGARERRISRKLAPPGIFWAEFSDGAHELLARPIEVEKLHYRFVDREGWTLKQFNDWMLSHGAIPWSWIVRAYDHAFEAVEAATSSVTKSRGFISCGMRNFPRRAPSAALPPVSAPWSCQAALASLAGDTPTDSSSNPTALGGCSRRRSNSTATRLGAQVEMLMLTGQP